MMDVLVKVKLAGIATALALAGCRPAPPAEQAARAPVHAVATVGMVADLVREVGGEQVEVACLMGAGVDPHLYKPTRDDVALLLRADIVFYCGHHLEGKMARVLHRTAATRPALALAETLPPNRLLHAGSTDSIDPHVWMDVELWAQCVPAIARWLARIDPVHRADYHTRAAQLVDRLRRLDAYGKRVLATIPPRARVLVTSHDAFRYFGRAYGLEVQGIQGISTESEAGLRRINDLVDQIVRRKIQAVFVESSVSRKSIQALLDGAAARGHVVRVGGELFSDSMGPPGTYEGTYVGMMDHNFTVVARALGGSAPARGMAGKLRRPARSPQRDKTM